eukprot:COSAG01_NODE_4218_length_5229_cov_16.645419_8_plen_77_part_00
MYCTVLYCRDLELWWRCGGAGRSSLCDTPLGVSQSAVTPIPTSATSESSTGEPGKASQDPCLHRQRLKGGPGGGCT